MCFFTELLRRECYASETRADCSAGPQPRGRRESDNSPQKIFKNILKVPIGFVVVSYNNKWQSFWPPSEIFSLLRPFCSGWANNELIIVTPVGLCAFNLNTSASPVIHPIVYHCNIAIYKSLTTGLQKENCHTSTVRAIVENVMLFSLFEIFVRSCNLQYPTNHSHEPPLGVGFVKGECFHHFSSYSMNLIDSHSGVDDGVIVGYCRINSLLFADDLVLYIVWTEASTCTWSVFYSVRQSWNEN